MFGLGVALLLLTFALTVQLFYGVDTSLHGAGPYLSAAVTENPPLLPNPDQAAQTEEVSPLLVMVMAVGLKFLGLFVMGYVASLVATKGIQFAHAPFIPTTASMEETPAQ